MEDEAPSDRSGEAPSGRSGEAPSDPSGDPAARSGEREVGVWWLVASVLAALVIAGAGGYLLGKGKGEDDGKKSGRARGLVAGSALEAAKYKPGEPEYQAIYDAGVRKGIKEGARTGEAAGERSGTKQGEQIGFQQGQTQGDTQGADAALTFSSWSPGALYAIQMESGQTVPYSIASRHLLEPGVTYRLCADDPQKLCDVG